MASSKVSVIIPVFNAESTIAKTIESVLLHQNFDGLEFEVIIVNDGSTDSSEMVIKQFDHDVKYFKTENCGVSAARNLGLSKSDGGYIQYLDSDDLLATDKIKNQILLLKSSGADVAYGDYMRFTYEGEIRHDLEKKAPFIQADAILESFDGFWCPPAAMLYTREICDRIGAWHPNLPIIQDARYIFDAAWQGANFVKSEGLAAYYHVGSPNSLSAKNKLSFVKDCFANAREVKSLWLPDITNTRKAALIKTFRYCINEFSMLQADYVDQVIDEILDLDPLFIPDNGKVLHYLSRIFGYRRAEQLAMLKRKFN